LLDPQTATRPLGCTILRDAVFWPKDRWIPWTSAEGWAPNHVRGKTERDSTRAVQLLSEIQRDALHVPADFLERFRPLEVDERTLVLRESVEREGQGTFRLRLLDAYGGRCAVTGEHTEPVLDAAHIQPYLGPSSNHVQNGILLTKEFHALFDRGYVGVTPDHEIRVSERLRTDWHNGHRYYPFDRKKLLTLPDEPAFRPSPEALEWHLDHIFMRAG
jgi:putative restriction endonuclease